MAVSIESRNKYWTIQSSRVKRFLYRVPLGSFWTIHHRVTRLWGLDFGGAVFQLVYLAAIITGAVVVFVEALSDSPDGWAIAASVSASTIFAYKAWSGGGIAPLEFDRRQSIASLLDDINRVTRLEAADSLAASESKGQLVSVCECVRRDIQMQTAVQESQIHVSLLVLDYINENVRKKDSMVLRCVAKNRPRATSWSREPRPVLESYAYEAIRLSRTVVFHDVKSKSFQAVFPDESRPYRSVYCMPITRNRAATPFGVLTVNVDVPYVFWPLFQHQVEKLLVQYQSAIDLLIGQSHEESIALQQYELF